MKFFLKERTYACSKCGGKLITTFDETDLECPYGCGEQMNEVTDEPPEEDPKEEEKLVAIICKKCGYFSWIPYSEDPEDMLCDTCGELIGHDYLKRLPGIFLDGGKRRAEGDTHFLQPGLEPVGKL